MENINEIEIIVEEQDVNFNRFISVDTRDLTLAEDNLDELSPSFVTQRVVRGKASKGGGVTAVILVNNKRTGDALNFVRARLNQTSAVTSSIPLSTREAWDRYVTAGGSQNYMAAVDADGYLAAAVQLPPQPGAGVGVDPEPRHVDRRRHGLVEGLAVRGLLRGDEDDGPGPEGGEA